MKKFYKNKCQTFYICYIDLLNLYTNSIDQYNLKFMTEFTISGNLKCLKISILFMLRFKSKVIF